MRAFRFPRACLSALVLQGAALAGVMPQAPTTQESAQDKLVDLAVVDTDIRDALRLVARQCGVNMAISNEVQGKITLELEQASLAETLDAIVAIGGFQYTITGKIVTVQTLAELLEQRKQRDEFRELTQQVLAPDPQTLVLELRYVDAERIEPIVKSLLSETGSVSILKSSDHVARDRGGAGEGASSQSELQIGTKLSTSSVGEPAKSHTLVILDEPDRLARIRSVVASIDVKPPQVVIAARFVEISLDDEQRLGIDWNVLAQMNGASTPHTAPFGSSSLGSIDPLVEGGSPGGIFPPASPTITSPGQPGLFTFGTLDFTTFSAILEMIQSYSDIRIVSNPSVTVRDRHTATILVGERYPILSANISEFGTVTEQLDHYEPIGVQLAVTPSVLGDEVELLVRPSSSSLGPDVEGSTGLGVARINSRQIDTLVTVKDGQTVVIGGLITTRDVATKTRVPFLGSVPLVGRLFQHDGKTKERVDLVIFLTVSINQENGLTPEQRGLFEDAIQGADTLLSPRQRAELELVPSPPQF